MSKSNPDDEDELQALLEDAPDPKQWECSFCTDKADRLISPEDLGLNPADFTEDAFGGSLPICDGCYRDEFGGGHDDDCENCEIGNWCDKHKDDALAWFVASLADMIIDATSDEEYDGDYDHE